MLPKTLISDTTKKNKEQFIYHKYKFRCHHKAKILSVSRIHDKCCQKHSFQIKQKKQRKPDKNKETNKQTHKHTHKQPTNQTNTQTNKQAKKQTNKKTNTQTNKHTNAPLNLLVVINESGCCTPLIPKQR